MFALVKALRRPSKFELQTPVKKLPEKVNRNKTPPDDLKTVLKGLADSSSLHGVPKIVSSPQIAVKALWCILFLGAFGLLTWQVYNLIVVYLSNPVDTKVSLKFSQLRLPAITFCNMNPVKNSRMTKALRDALNDTHQSASSRRKRGINESPIGYDEYGPSVWNKQELPLPFNDEPPQLYDDIVASAVAPPDDNAVDLQPSEHSDVYKYTEHLQYIETLLHRYKRSGGSSSSSGSSGDTSSSPASSSSDTESSSYSSSYDSDSESDDHESSYDASLSSYIDDVFDGERDDWETKRRRFQYEFKKMPRNSRAAIGHTVQDMVIKATFLRINRNESKFTRLDTPEYGNCYTIDDNLFRSWRSGPSNGIKLTLNLQKEEYVENLNTAYGVRVVFHEPGTMPLPAQEGILLSPGTETNVALRMVHLSRLGEPYGDCEDGDLFYHSFGVQYTAPTCLHICRTQLVLEICQCLPVDAPELNFGTNDPVCDMLDEAVEKCVLFRVDGALASGELECKCPVPCSEVVYEKTLSWRRWPSDDYMENVLFKDMCNGISDFAEYFYCKDDYDMEPEEWHQNFLRVVLYYETLDYEQIVESPSYVIYRFASDVGGTLGLCIGASLLSLVEFLHLGMEVCLWVYRRVKYGRRVSPDTNGIPGENLKHDAENLKHNEQNHNMYE